MKKKKLNAYEEVVNAIIQNIHSGKYPKNQKLPSEYDLATEFDVSRLTIRKAIEELVKNQILIKSKSRGTYIMAHDKIQSGSNGLQGFTESLTKYGMKSNTKVIELNEIFVPTSHYMALFNLQDGETIYTVKRVRYADGEPMVIEEITVPAKYVPQLTKEKAESQSIFSLIEEVIEIGYSQQEIGAILVTEDISPLLDVPIAEPLIHVESMTYSIEGHPILTDTSYYRADKYTFKNILQRNS
ncbi:GntR family transcriptional regulator [Vagococcus sp. BWB3-3]|uniref:GntR family transcriptional regulator n=1 Tax=Vagococcus allomyrinae TaxID=2794353 RepID=A0A940P783_9ENTE|nr:GntR family transcriptional regulator, LSA1692 subfamily [Vagococcus allomyrinae]MBP1042949.1 GntR family transcriptional regulator [Vagococcus allomyrinae]